MLYLPIAFSVNRLHLQEVSVNLTNKYKLLKQPNKINNDHLNKTNVK